MEVRRMVGSEEAGDVAQVALGGASRKERASTNLVSGMIINTKFKPWKIYRAKLGPRRTFCRKILSKVSSLHRSNSPI
jgi:hypothetical protein